MEVKKEAEHAEENSVKPDPSFLENDSVKVKKEGEPDEEQKLELGIKLVHGVPALHSSMREHQNLRSTLFLSYNRFKRALSARTDLSLRFANKIFFKIFKYIYLIGRKNS